MAKLKKEFHFPLPFKALFLKNWGPVLDAIPLVGDVTLNYVWG